MCEIGVKAMGDNIKVTTPLKQKASEGGRVMRQERQESSLKKAGGTTKSKGC